MNARQFIAESFNAWIMTKNWWMEIENICEFVDVLYEKRNWQNCFHAQSRIRHWYGMELNLTNASAWIQFLILKNIHKRIKCGSFNSIINLARKTFFCCCYFRKSCEEQLSADLSCNDIEYYSNGIKQFIYQNIKYLIPLYLA